MEDTKVIDVIITESRLKIMLGLEEAAKLVAVIGRRIGDEYGSEVKLAFRVPTTGPDGQMELPLTYPDSKL